MNTRPRTLRRPGAACRAHDWPAAGRGRRRARRLTRAEKRESAGTGSCHTRQRYSTGAPAGQSASRCKRAPARWRGDRSHREILRRSSDSCATTSAAQPRVPIRRLRPTGRPSAADAPSRAWRPTCGRWTPELRTDGYSSRRGSQRWCHEWVPR